MNFPRRSSLGALRRFATVAAATILLGATGASSPASAAFGIQAFTAGDSSPLAGAHPDITTRIAFNDAANGVAEGNVRDVDVDLPPGVLGDPTATPQCSRADLVAFSCRPSSQIGFSEVAIQGAGMFQMSVFNIQTLSNDETARLGFVVPLGAPLVVDIVAWVRTETENDYGVTAEASRVSRGANVLTVDLTLWGVPQDPSHDSQRVVEGTGTNGPGSNEIAPNPHLPRKPFLTNPTVCGADLPAILRVDSYQDPSNFLTATDLLTGEGGLVGCGSLPFAPSISFVPQSTQADSPTGYQANVHLPQNDNPDGQATSHLRKVVVTLPQGVSISPGSADGLGACDDAHLKLGSSEVAECPNDSKVATAEVDTPLLSGPLTGGVYLRTPQPGNLFRLAIVIDGFGIHAKIPGIAAPDPQTGRITATFEETPQIPFEDFKLSFKGGPRAPLANPSTCGSYTTTAVFTPWSGQADVTSNDSFSIGSGSSGGPCSATKPFAPVLRAGTTSPAAGTFSSLALNLTRKDGEQNVSKLDVTLPPGLLAKLAGVSLCPEVQAATGDCDASSQVGHHYLAAGSGPAPLWIPQPGKDPTAAYLAGPYHNAPYSLVVKTPAQAGPFDLGTVVVRAGIYVDPETAQVTVKSDPLPQILEGVPISYRTIHVDVDRSGFTINPTSCDPMSIDAAVISDKGTVANPSDRFQAGGCATLVFKPKLYTRLFGKTHRGAHPSFRSVLTMPRGDQANIARAVVSLPHSEFLDQGNIRTVCTRVQFAADACPNGSIYGYAVAESPLLDEPLRGPVYLRSSSNALPDLVAALAGQIEIDLVGRIDSVRGGIRTTFETVPDAPVSKFVLTMQGGKKGLLENSTDLCAGKNRAIADLTGQNGKRYDLRPALKADCGKARRHKRHGR